MAYGTVAGLAQYAAINGYSIDASPALLERASRVLDSLYSQLFLGERISWDAEWPRSGIKGLSENEIPLRVIEATYELAVIEATTPGALADLTEARKQGPVVRQKAGEVEIAFADPSKEYGFSAAEFGRPAFITGLLSPFLRPQRNMPVAYVV